MSDTWDDYDSGDERYDLRAGFTQTQRSWRSQYEHVPYRMEAKVAKKINVKSKSLKAKLAEYDRRIGTAERLISRLEAQKAAVDIESAEWFGTPVKSMDDSYLCNALRWAGRKFNVVQLRDYDYDKPYAVAGPGMVYAVYNIMFDEAVKRGLRF